MAKTIQLPNDVYEELKKFKKGLSFSETINILLEEYKKKKKLSKDNFLELLNELETRYAGREKENVSEKIDDVLWR